MKPLQVKTGKIYLSNNLKSDLYEIIKPFITNTIFVIADENTFNYSFPEIKDIKGIDVKKTIILKTGDSQKNIESLTTIWKFLVEQKADRHSLLINLGGGVICDLGGFAAATFKRGISFINIPTTLLAQVDASTGGKTGINFLGYKNEIGIIRQAEAVIINTNLLKSLDKEHILAGFTEIIKHALLKDEKTFKKVLEYNIDKIDITSLNELIAESLMIKDSFVSADPEEKNIRKALNLGHTIGHAFETFAELNGNPILHGNAVAYGLVIELYMSHLIFGCNIEIVKLLSNFIMSKYEKFIFSESDFEMLLEIMSHDKKNKNQKISFSLLKVPGDVVIDVFCEKKIIFEGLKYLL